jgi:pyruvate formate lyase activating enzyme
MIALREAMFYTNKGENVICNLCPHFCRLGEGQRGRCGVRQNIGGKLYSLNYERVTAYNYDPIEKKPLYHFYPGSTIFSFGSYGCNLGCDFCQNWQIVTDHNSFVEANTEDILALAKMGGSIGIAYTYNEPTVFYEFVLDTARKAREEGLLNVLVTNGYINREPLEELLQYIDAMNIDLKSFTNDFYQSICKGTLEPVLETIRLAARKTHVELTTLIIDDRNSSNKEMEELSGFIASIDPGIPFHLSRYYPNYRMKDPPTSVYTLTELKNTAEKKLKHVYIGNVLGYDNDTYCPECRKRLIGRSSGIRIEEMVEGRCSQCGYKVPGRF